MRRSWVVGIAGAVLAGGLSTGGILAASADTDKEKPSSAAPAKAGAAEGNGRGFGPPPWAHGQKDSAKGSDKGWKDAWRALTPAEREQTMRRLSKAHADGMSEFAKCAADAGADQAARADCEKPLPPGHAKRDL